MNISTAIIEENTLDFERFFFLFNEWCTLHSTKISLSRLTRNDISLSHNLNNFDVIFISICEKSKINYIELCKNLRLNGYNNKLVIFSDKKQDTLDYYHMHVFDFFTKPINKKTLFHCLEDCSEVYNTNTYTIQNRSSSTVLNVSEILFVEKNERSVAFHTLNSIYYETSSLHSVLLKLPNYFYQCHRSFIINFNYILSIQNDLLITTNNDLIPIGRKYAKKIKNLLLG